MIEPSLETRLLRRLANNAGLVQRVVQTFLESLPGALAALEEAVGSNDLEAIRKSAHRLKGASAYFEVEPLTRAASVLESREPDGERRRQAYSQLLAAVAQLQLELQALLERRSA